MAESEVTTIHKTFEYKLRENAKFVEVCERELEHSRQIYNAALEERINCYRITGHAINYVEQSRHLTDARSLPELKSHLRTIQSDALERLDEAFKAFFKRVGVDVGISSFATLSTGKQVENPRHLANASENLTKLQRKLSRKKRGSANRRKARQKVALAHLKVQRTRGEAGQSF